ncbi:MAG: DUF47 domain-containing protein [Atopobiaceae bacterium]|jgi:uncharacterized protein Yka (UPF0111/DUF47 family)
MPHKKEDHFYTLFRDFAKEIVSVAADYEELVSGYPASATLIPVMRVHEDRCDEHVRKIMKELYSSFITPFDRNDISDLALKLDDIVDYMEGSSLRLDLFNMHGMRDEGKQMARLTREAVNELYVMIDHLPNYKTDSVVMEKAISVGHIEDAGDQVYESALHELFHEEDIEEYRRGHVVGWLRVFDRMEMCLDACDAAAGVVRSVVMKSA